MVVASTSVAARVTPLRGGSTTVIHLRASFQGPAARVWDPEVHCENARSAPRPVEFMCIANLLAERTAEACSIVRSWARFFLVCSGAPVWGSLFDMAPHVELARAGASRTDFGLPSVVTDLSTLRHVLHLKARSPTIPPVRGVSPVPKPEVVSNRCEDTTRVGMVQLWCSAFAVYSTSANTRLAAIIASHLRGKSASGGPKAVGPGSTGVPDNVMFR